ncbi:MAG: ribonucleoside-triphosphate reductase, adenosylcobalamin-dependent [Acidimicrobiales bacterium]
MSVTDNRVVNASQNSPGLLTASGIPCTLIRDFLAGKVDASLLPEPNWGPIGKEVYERTYSRHVPLLDATGAVVGARRETWAETVRRVVNGSLSYIDPEHWQTDEPEDLFDLIYNFKAIPAGRHLWVTGTDVAHFSKNCWAAGHVFRTSAHFAFLASRLFEGGGVGSNYSADVLAATSPIVGTLDLSFACHPEHEDYDKVAAVVGEGLDTVTPSAPRRAAGIAIHPGSLYAGSINAGVIRTSTLMVVDDSREGWVDVWSRLIDLSTQPGHHTVKVDVSNVRPYGATLKTFGGTASGPEALVVSSLAITAVLNRAAARGGPLTGMEAMQIDHEIASAVVAGGSRRSARMSLLSWKDPQIMEFIHCKANPAMHWTTNISVEIDDDFHAALADPAHALHDRAEAVLAEVAVGMARDGEPGMVDTSAHSADEPMPIRITNPCSETSLQSYGPDQVIYGESCNLGSVDLAAFGTDTFSAHRAFELMARFLYRATLNAHPDPAAHTIEATNRRIGVGIMGLQGWVAAHGRRLSELASSDDLAELLTDFRYSVRLAADQLACELGLPCPVKVTAVAPTGTIAQLGGTTPGIHPVYARHFVRRVRYQDTDRALPELAAAGHKIVDDIYAANTKVVEFIMRDTILDQFPASLIEQADELSVGQFFDLIAVVQRTFCGPLDGQAVSATAQIAPGGDAAELATQIRSRLGVMKGFTVFPATTRPLQPYEALSEDEYQAAKLAGLVALSGDSNSGECAGGSCPIR